MISSKTIIVAFSSLAVYSCSWLYFSHVVLLDEGHRGHLPSPPSHAFRAPKTNVWAELDAAEFDDLLHFLHRAPAGLSLSKEEAETTRWQLLFAETLWPNKTDVLPYVDGTAGPPPPRWARISVNQADEAGACIADYMVGPLPASNATAILPLDYCYNSGRNYVRSPVPNIEALKKWLDRELTQVADITLELLGSEPNSLNHSDPNGLEPTMIFGSLTESGMTSWLQFCRLGHWSGARSLLSQGLAAKIQLTRSGDSGEWQILDWFYNDVFYHSTAALRAAVRDPGFARPKPNLDGAWTDTEDYGEGPPGRQMPPPVMVQPSGPRFRIDRQENFVSWMGFEFYFATNQITGVSLFDVRFKGERIIYELGMMEALSHYAGTDPVQSGLYFLDTFFGMGKRMFELVPGYDCPAYATYLSTSYHEGESTRTINNNICLFEYTADHALQRHTKANSVSISRNQYLVLRSVSTVGNYDYTIEYLFYLDGSVEVKYRASGFIFGAFYNTPLEDDVRHTRPIEHGYRVHDAVATSMHDHVLNFKVDFDIAGTANTLMRVGIEPTASSYPWENPGTPPRNTMHLTNTPVSKESGLNWPRNAGEIYLVMNNDSTNAWGEKRGYRITPGTGMGTPIHLTIQNSSSLGRGGSWAYQDLFVLRQKDTEPKSGSPLNFVSIDDPLVDFAKMVDDEDTVQEDLVVYFNLGGHHIPHAGDIPNTLMHTSASSVMFVPHNFHIRDPSRETVQGVKLEFEEGGKHNVSFFGGRYTEGVKLEVGDLEGDLSRYQASMHDVTDLSFNKSILGSA